MHSRYVCTVLEEIRVYLTQHEIKYSVAPREMAHLRGLIEETQTYVNRMEASLGDNWSIHRIQERLSSLRKEETKLNKELKTKKAGDSPVSPTDDFIADLFDD